MALIKFKHFHTSFDFNPEGIETEFTGVCRVEDDGDGGEIWAVEQIYVNGVEQQRTYGATKEWTRFLDALIESAQQNSDEYNQVRITLPEGNLFDKEYPQPTRRNLDAIKEAMPGASIEVLAQAAPKGINGNAHEVPLYMVTSYEITPDEN